tara:strand:+ start:379 stop:483 length:105 start_codon:yes stop_codon:yes gene_type:complete
MSKTNLQEKIEVAQKRIDELLLLIEAWKKQDEKK